MSYQFNKQEEKIRLEWLFATRVTYAVFCALGVFFVQREEPIRFFWLGVTVPMLLSFLMYRIMKYCAYKKHGTAWLTFVLALTVFCEVLGIFEVLSLKESLPQARFSAAVTTCLSVWWVVLSLRLRRVNERVAEHEALQQKQKFIPLLESLNVAANRQELDTAFSRLVGDWPQFEPIISKTYEEKKLILGSE